MNTPRLEILYLHFLVRFTLSILQLNFENLVDTDKKPAKAPKMLQRQSYYKLHAWKIAVFKIFSLRMFKFPHYPFKPPSMKPTLTWRGVYLTKRFHPVSQQGELAFERHLLAFHQGRLMYYVNICHLSDGAIYHIVFFPLRMGRDFVFGRFRNWDKGTCQKCKCLCPQHKMFHPYPQVCPRHRCRRKKLLQSGRI